MSTAPNNDAANGAVDDNDEGEKPRTLVIRAQDGDWLMGEDLVLTVTGDETVVEIQEVQLLRYQQGF